MGALWAIGSKVDDASINAKIKNRMGAYALVRFFDPMFSGLITWDQIAIFVNNIIDEDLFFLYITALHDAESGILMQFLCF